MIEKKGYVYILTTAGNTVLYTGTTSDLIKRVYEHKNKMAGGFTKKYNVHKLVYYEVFEDIISAITREKQIKGWLRSKKIYLIKKFNPAWLIYMRQLFELILRPGASPERSEWGAQNDGVV